MDMGKKRFSPEQIITMLREAEVLLGQGTQVAEVWRDGLNIGVREMEIILPVSLTIQPVAKNEFCGFDLASSQAVKMRFALPSGSPAILEIIGKNSIRATK